MKGLVLDFDVKSNEGVLRGEDGRRYVFKADACKKDIPLAGCEVDFEESFGAVSEIYVTSVPKTVWLDRLFWFLFSFRGRISRDSFLVFLAGAFCVFPILTLFAAYSPVVSGAANLALFLSVYVGSCVIVKRFHDTGTGGWWLGAALVVGVYFSSVYAGVLASPFRNLTVIYALLTLYGLLVLFCLYCCFAKGDIGENSYGKEPPSCKTIRLK